MFKKITDARYDKIKEMDESGEKSAMHVKLEGVGKVFVGLVAISIGYTIMAMGGIK